MAELIRLPKMFDNMTHGKIVKWHKDVGDTVANGDTIAEIETDKAIMELESYAEGKVLYRAEAGELMVGRMICIVGEIEEDITDLLEADQRQADFLVYQTRSIRTFIGASDYDLSIAFYEELGFHGSHISADMTYFRLGTFGFYLQKYYVKDWVNNSMVFLEVEDVEATFEHLKLLKLPEKFEGVKLTPIKEEAWGKECFLHDPSGVLWHFGEFYD